METPKKSMISERLIPLSVKTKLYEFEPLLNASSEPWRFDTHKNYLLYTYRNYIDKVSKSVYIIIFD